MAVSRTENWIYDGLGVINAGYATIFETFFCKAAGLHADCLVHDWRGVKTVVGIIEVNLICWDAI